MNIKQYLSVAMATSLLFASGSSWAQQYPDNAGVNKRDRVREEVSADEQGQSKADIQITQEIRKAVLEQKSASLYAKNIKVVTKDGVVTLKGPVSSMEERLMLVDIASKVPGVNSVRNEIDVLSK